MDLVDYWLFILQSLLIQMNHDETSTADLSSRLLPVHERIGQWFGTAKGWLGNLVHPIANHHFWIHTRSAFLSETSWFTLPLSTERECEKWIEQKWKN